jgi:subtilisin family serine protease
MKNVLVLLSGLALVLVGLGVPGGAHARQPNPVETRWIVVLEDAPTTRYDGAAVAGVDRAGRQFRKQFQATSPEHSGVERLDAESTPVRLYVTHLDQQRSAVLERAEQELGRPLAPRHVYRHVLNGFAVEMDDAEAELLRRLPGVRAVEAETVEFVHTDAGPGWIGAPLFWAGAGGVPNPNRGEGMVLGVVDTGVNWDSVFFDAAASGNPALSNPRPGFLGLCSDPEVLCSGKLIGVYDFTDEGTKGKDPDGHGSHVASTAVGFPLSFSLDFDGPGPIPGINFATSGVAPRASFIAYKACEENPDGGNFRCFGSDTTAALEQAVVNAVDVINYSIGGGPSNPWAEFSTPNTTTAEVMFNVREAGILVSVSAGNDGPLPGTVGSPANAPWVFSIANSTHGRILANQLTNTFGGDFALGNLVGQGLSAGTTLLPIVHAADFGNALCGEGPAELGPACSDNTGASNPFAPGTFNGLIVVCDRGVYGRVEKGRNVLAAGAAGMILANTDAEGESINGDQHCLPATHVGATDGERLRQWLNSGSNHAGMLTGTTRLSDPDLGGVVTSSSSRGPAQFAADVMKPNVIAPGTNILAAGSDGANSLQFLTGTSMSAPHVAGAALLLRKSHPGWGVNEVISALETTADASVNSLGGGVEAATVDRGAGNIRVERAARAGLFLPVSGAQFLAANPSLGGNPGNLNLPGIAIESCEVECAATRTVRALGAGTWNVSAEGPLDIDVTPASFTLSAGQERTISISIRPGSAQLGNWGSGSVVLSPVGGNFIQQRLPVGAFITGGTLPDLTQFSATDNRGRSDLLIPSLIPVSELVVRTSPLTRPQQFSDLLPEDATSDDPFDGGPGVRTRLIQVPPNTLMLHAETFTSTSNDVDLFVGRDLNGDGQAQPEELLCQSISATDLERCQLASPAAGNWWVLIQNWAASSSGQDNVPYEIAVLSDSRDRSLVAFGPGVHPGGSLNLPVYWDQAEMLRNQRWIGAIGLASSPDEFADLGATSVAVLRTGVGSIAETAIFPGRDNDVLLPAGARHRQLYIDLPETATALTVDILGQDLDANLSFLGFDALANSVPATPLAPEDFVAGSQAINGGRRISINAADGQTLGAGRWFVVIDNEAATERVYAVEAEVVESGTVQNLRGLWGPEARAINQGIDWQIGGGGNFAVWYTYDEDGLPTFYISNTVAPVAGSSFFNAELFRATSNDERNFLTPVGEVQITSVEPGRLMYAWRLNGNHGAESYDSNINSTCPLVDGVPSQRTGHWVSPDTSAGGVTLLATSTAEAWIRYFYDSLNRPRWVLADEELPPTLPGGVLMEVLDFRGFCIYCDPVPVSREVVGTLERQFIDPGSTREVSDFLVGPPLNASVQNDRTVARATFTPACSNP